MRGLRHDKYTSISQAKFLQRTTYELITHLTQCPSCNSASRTLFDWVFYKYYDVSKLSKLSQTRSSKDECRTDVQSFIWIDRSLSSIDQKILMPPPPLFCFSEFIGGRLDVLRVLLTGFSTFLFFVFLS